MEPPIEWTPIRVILLYLLDEEDCDRQRLTRLSGYPRTTIYDNLKYLQACGLVYTYLYVEPVRTKGRPRTIFARTTRNYQHLLPMGIWEGLIHEVSA